MGVCEVKACPLLERRPHVERTPFLGSGLSVLV